MLCSVVDRAAIVLFWVYFAASMKLGSTPGSTTRTDCDVCCIFASRVRPEFVRIVDGEKQMVYTPNVHSSLFFLFAPPISNINVSRKFQ